MHSRLILYQLCMYKIDVHPNLEWYIYSTPLLTKLKDLFSHLVIYNLPSTYLVTAYTPIHCQPVILRILV